MISINSSSTLSNSRGFAEKSKDGIGAIPDFFDSLLPPRRKQKN